LKRKISLLIGILFIIVALGYGAISTVKNGRSAHESNNVGTVAESKAVPLVEGFPKDFPLIEGKVTASMSTNSVDPEEGTPTGVSYYTQIRTDLSLQEAMEFYKTKFTKIVKQEPQRKGSPAMYSGFINKYSVNIYFIEQKDRTMLTIILSSSQKD